ncbi:MAG: TPM domain-containing protein [Bacteroidota bacterium]
MRTIAFFLSCLFALPAYSQDPFLPEKPGPPRLYNNLSKEFPQLLSSAEAGILEEKLISIAEETSNQVAVVIVDDFGGSDANDFGTRLFNKWGIGKDNKDNGVLILVKPTERDGGREVFIVTGYGLESVLPDITCKKIIERDMLPHFRNGDYSKGLLTGVDVIYGFIKGEISEKDYSARDRGGKIPWKYVVIAIILFIIISRIGRGFGGGYTIGRGGYYRGGFGGFGGFGGGGGGFGGFGGGSSGGGGAGGRW